MGVSSLAIVVRFLHFGPPAKPLFGALHGGRRLRQPASGVVLCNPFGEEAARSHRIYRVLARDLEAKGYPTLRFDYHGTGDSAGETAEGSVDLWLDDIVTAVEELAEEAKPKRMALLGLRLGGSLAALAAARRRLTIAHLLLWDPVVRGRAYLRELSVAHAAYMRSELAEWREPSGSDDAPSEALGTPLDPALREAIAAVDLTALDLSCDQVTVVSTQPGQQDMAALKQHLEGSSATRATWLEVATTTPWNSDEALNSAIIPKDVMNTLVEHIEAVSS